MSSKVWICRTAAGLLLEMDLLCVYLHVKPGRVFYVIFKTCAFIKSCIRKRKTEVDHTYSDCINLFFK